MQMGNLYHLFDEIIKGLPHWQRDGIYSFIHETVNELILAGFLYYGKPGDQSNGYPWLTITEYGKQAFASENWLPYDPEGYVNSLNDRIPEIDEVTLAYISEAISAFNRRHLLSATLTLGVASENLMVLLIEAYLDWIDAKRRGVLEKKIRDRFIYTQYKEFKQEFSKDVSKLPKALQGDWETYLDGVFNFIRLNRNSAGHPTGKKLGAKIVYSNLQVFSEYARYIFDLIGHLRSA